MSDQWSGRRVTQMRAIVATWLPAPCGQCKKVVQPGDEWVVGHKIARWERPDLMWSLSNVEPEHRACSDKTGQAEVIAKAKFEALKQAGFSGPGGSRQPSPLPISPRKGRNGAGDAQNPTSVVRTELEWGSTAQSSRTWLLPVLSIPNDAAAPLAMTPPHHEAVDSYGPDAIVWIETQFNVKLRWWQQLTVIRMLEHRDDGSLCWKTILLSASRRSGKSILLRALACWRLAHADLFGETQTVLHFGSDTAITREVQRGAWRWAEEVAGFKVSRANGKEAVETPNGDRWLTRAKDAVYGYDVSLGLGDEVWDVPDSTVTDGVEPAMLERISPQLLLTSTAHRRARPTMKKRMASALAQDDDETLLLLWAARPEDDPSAESTWRAASPHWSEDRRKTLAAKYQAAKDGEVDAELDDPDPMAGFTSQYLNVWRFNEAALEKGEPVVEKEEWEEYSAPLPQGQPLAVAVEAWFAEGVAVSAAYPMGGVVCVSTQSFPDAASAATWVRELSAPTVIVGKSLAPDPAFIGLPVEAKGGTSKQAVQDFRRLLDEGALFHDDSETLTVQALGVRGSPSTDGFRIRSTIRLDGIKAATWAAEAARTAAEAPMIW